MHKAQEQTLVNLGLPLLIILLLNYIGILSSVDS